MDNEIADMDMMPLLNEIMDKSEVASQVNSALNNVTALTAQTEGDLAYKVLLDRDIKFSCSF